MNWRQTTGDTHKIGGRPKRGLVNILKVALAGGFLVGLTYFDVVDVSYFLRLHEHFGAIALSLLLITTATGLSVQRWRLLLAIKGISIGYADLWHINYLGLFSNNFLPSGAGGDLVRCYLIIRRAKGQVTKGVFSIGMDRIMGLLALLTLFVGIFLYRHSATAWNTPLFNSALVVAVAGYVGIVCFGCLLMFDRNIRFTSLADKLKARDIRFVNDLFEIVSGYRSNLYILLWCFFLSLVMQGLTLVVIAILSVSLNLGAITAIDYSLSGAVALIASVVPLTPGGFGVAEVVFDQVCKLLVSDVTGSFGTAYFMFRAVGMLFSLPAVFFYSSALKRPKNEAEIPPNL